MDNSKLHIVAVSGLVEKDNKYLILKRSDKEIAFPGKWAIPGGKVEKGQGILETLRREIKEEAGIEVEKSFAFLCDDEFVRPDNYHVVVLCFQCRYKDGRVKISKDFTDFRWININEIAKYDLIEGVKNDFKCLKNNWTCCD
jgi:8-oxo-dGTP pyrophosphatase MutT (NUDIX family)